MNIIKRNGEVQKFDVDKIRNAVRGAIIATDFSLLGRLNDATDLIMIKLSTYPNQECVSVETIQDIVENSLIELGLVKVAKNYILYRYKHQESRLIKDRIDYMKKYSDPSRNAATSSETDSNANVTMKNVANLEGEVYKTTNRIIQRQRMKDKLTELYPEVAKQYEKDLDHHIIYTHDEATTPVLKQYCMAVSLYPLMTEGVGNIDGVTPSAPNDLQSFSGQITNLAFLLSSQCKGAVAFGEYFIALNYYVIKEFGEK